MNSLFVVSQGRRQNILCILELLYAGLHSVGSVNGSSWKKTYGPLLMFYVITCFVISTGAAISENQSVVFAICL